MRDLTCLMFLLPLACAVVLCAAPCYGSGKIEPPDAVQADAPASQPVQRFGANNGLEFIGVAGRLSDRNASINAALRDAARRLSFFYSVSGCAEKRERIGDKILDYEVSADYCLQYDDDLDKFLDELEFDPVTGVHESNNAVFVITRWKKNVPMPPSGGYTSGKERPWWANSPPSELGGFAAGVGFSSRFDSHKDTVIASYEKAVIAIIANSGSVVRGEHSSYQNTGSVFDFSARTGAVVVSGGTLKHFYVIESWTDPANLSVWTLAVAQP